jgi:FeS assembly SUF system protein
MENNILQLESEIATVLRSIYDPEIPVNIFDLGLIYEINIDDNRNVEIVMTMTAPNCPMADEMVAEVNEKVKLIPSVTSAKVTLTFEPEWTKEMMSEEALLELGLL